MSSNNRRGGSRHRRSRSNGYNNNNNNRSNVNNKNLNNNNNNNANNRNNVNNNNNKNKGNSKNISKITNTNAMVQFYAEKQIPSSQNSLSACHLNITDAIRCEAELTLEVNAPKLIAENWVFYVPVPPTTSFQNSGSVKIMLDDPSIEAPDCQFLTDINGREVIQILVDVSKHKHFSKSIKLSYLFTVNLFGRDLYFDPNQSIPYQIADDTEIKSSLSVNNSFSFYDEEFKQWMESEGSILVRQQEEFFDQTVIYAQRVFSYITSNFEYFWSSNLDRSLTNIIETKKSDCGGLSKLFCSILRSQSIPARCVVGRWCSSKVKNDKSCHVVAEFYVDQIGWIPVDVASKILHGSKKQSSDQGKLPYFGEIGTNFLAFHIDYDFPLDSVYFGTSNLRHLQNPPHWVQSSQGSLQNHSFSYNWQILSRESL
eukprot:TRINITY_DN1564_c4_g1_i1.p1 TRINITY_DN1564_c4_g1~~TRINITY_DN1564_c4_g1_i1.p1  ORF type:complete len:427 (-),score=116.99 TRINITY_DN1564_c4_g1_i1:163-1443(-)